MVPWTKALLPQKQHQNINRCSSLPTARVWQALIHSHIKKKPPPSTTEKHTIPPLLSTHFPAWPMAETEAEPRLCLWMGHSGFLNTLSWHGWPTRQPPWLVDSLSGNLALRSWWSLGLGQTNQWPKKRDHLHCQWPRNLSARSQLATAQSYFTAIVKSS